jgi:hypothetical protein
VSGQLIAHDPLADTRREHFSKLWGEITFFQDQVQGAAETSQEIDQGSGLCLNGHVHGLLALEVQHANSRCGRMDDILNDTQC